MFWSLKKMNRAIALVEFKTLREDEHERVIEGIATTPEVDRVGDTVVPEGAQFKLPLPLLYQHDHRQPIGEVTEAKVSKTGIRIKAIIKKIPEAGKLKDRIDEAWQSIKYGLVKGLSIGFQAIERVHMENGGYKFTLWEWYELSTVTVAANAPSSITQIRSIDREIRAASGREDLRSDERVFPGVTGNPTKTSLKRNTTMKTYAERIAAKEAARAATVAQMKELDADIEKAGMSANEEQNEKFEDLKAEIKEYDSEIVRLKQLAKFDAENASPVENIKSVEDGSAARAKQPARSITVRANLAKGVPFARMALSIFAAKGDRQAAAAYAERRWGDQSRDVAQVLKAPVSAFGSTITGPNPLVPLQYMESEFIELLRDKTIMDRIQGWRRVPFDIVMNQHTQGAISGWVGELQFKPVSEERMEPVNLGRFKQAVIVPVSEEALERAPNLDEIFVADMIAASVAMADNAMLNAGFAGTLNISPASLAHLVAPVVATGTSISALRADIKAVIAKFIAAKIPLTGAVWVMPETQAVAIAMMENAIGGKAFPGMNLDGGSLEGIPVITSENIDQTAVVGPPAVPIGNRIFLIAAPEVLLAREDSFRIDYSREGTLVMDTAPAVGATPTFSLFQQNAVGIRVERPINFKKRRAAAVQFIAGANYGS
jgi:HK97 family phage major capsid protein/HK97 family phage prohead protease